MPVDYGSHRFHPSCDPEVLRDLRALLGDDLVDRPRHGRIRLRGRWIHFPLRLLDVAVRLPPAFALGVVGDSLAKLAGGRGAKAAGETFASVLETGLGRTICRDFYFPYARKIWGVEPEALAVTQARRRVGANSLGKMARRLLGAVPGFRQPGAGRFFYPRQGYGQISRSLFAAAAAAGAHFEFNASVRTVERGTDVVRGVTYDQEGTTRSVEADYVWSTLPVTVLVRCLRPEAPRAVLDAARWTSYRAMILVYLVLEQDRFTEYDAHYFPEAEIRITRLSEPKNYSGVGPPGRTVLCAELPCSTLDADWALSDDDLGRVVCEALERAGLPVRAPVKEVVTRRLPYAYPIYHQGYEEHFELLDRYVAGFGNLLTFGRQGLFAHDNTHHALFMAYAAVECLGADGGFDHGRWRRFRRVFETHVVED